MSSSGPVDDSGALVDLACHDVGGNVLYANNEFFAEAVHLLRPGRAVFDSEAFCMTGKVMDGWETARHGSLDNQRNGHDFCIIRLGIPGIISKVDVDTLWFTGNYPESAMVEAATAPEEMSWIDLQETVRWFPIVPRSALVSGVADRGHNIFDVVDGESLNSLHHRRRFTHVKLSIFPDGGVSRLRVYGRASPNWEHFQALNIPIDLASVKFGGQILWSSNSFYSTAANLLLPGRAANMGGGWETKRSRNLIHHESVIVKLGCQGVIHAIEIDTSHFRGNFPHQFRIDAALCDKSSALHELKWDTLVETRAGRAHHRMVVLLDEMVPQRIATPITHIKLICIPDGGVSRLRVYCSGYSTNS
uniref:Allantoicase domain-containing protein n=1 Tax=Spongospora subterranea TaxID=70186 RepID=A0A0H5RM68_9EUKA|eukprot:CRZ09794.1 hypothetical protein [Spongospora subterranea]